MHILHACTYFAHLYSARSVVIRQQPFDQQCERSHLQPARHEQHHFSVPNIVKLALLAFAQVPTEDLVNGTTRRLSWFVRDSCKVNGSATTKLLSTFDNADDLLCFCHTLANTGDQ